MGKLIPFKQKQSSEEKVLRKRLQTNPDDLEIWGKLLESFKELLFAKGLFERVSFVCAAGEIR